LGRLGGSLVDLQKVYKAGFPKEFRRLVWEGLLNTSELQAFARLKMP